jgi:hypothetical protein
VARIELQDALVALVDQLARLRDGHRLARGLVGDDEDVAAAAGLLVAGLLDEEDAMAVGGGLELARRGAHHVGALLVARAQVVGLAVAPGPDDQHEARDHDQHRPARLKHRLHEAGESDSRGEPDRHLALAVHAPQAEDDADEQRQGEHRGQVAEREEAEDEDDVLRRHRAIGRQAQRADQEIREDDGQEDHQRGAETPRQFLAYRRIE